MRYLLDTHALLWWLFDEPHLSQCARLAIANPQNKIYVSSASIWEASIKHKMGRLPAIWIFLDDIDRWLQKASFLHLPISWKHARLAGQLPLHHKDPFDRMLVAQSIEERVRLVSRDPLFEPYEIHCIW